MTGKQIKNGSLSQVEFKFAPPAGAKGEPGAAGPAGPGSRAKGTQINDQPFTLEPGADWQTIAELGTPSGNGGSYHVSGGVEEQSASKTTTATVELRLVCNGEVHALPSRSTVGVDASVVGVVSIDCNGFSPGAQGFQLQAQTTGAPVTIGRRNLAMAETVHLP